MKSSVMRSGSLPAAFGRFYLFILSFLQVVCVSGHAEESSGVSKEQSHVACFATLPTLDIGWALLGFDMLTARRNTAVPVVLALSSER